MVEQVLLLASTGAHEPDGSRVPSRWDVVRTWGPKGEPDAHGGTEAGLSVAVSNADDLPTAMTELAAFLDGAGELHRLLQRSFGATSFSYSVLIYRTGRSGLTCITFPRAVLAAVARHHATLSVNFAFELADADA